MTQETQPASTTIKRRRGRPSSTAATGEDPKQAICSCAAHLFKEQGFEQTSMTAIAHSVGLSQSSLYYWFKSKEQLLDEILLSGFRACEYHGKLARFDAPCAERLYAMTYRRTVKYCQLPVDFYEIERIIDHNPKLLKQFASEFESYKADLKLVIQEGLDNGEFSFVSANEGLQMAISVITAQQHLFHRQNAAMVLPPAEQGATTASEVLWPAIAAKMTLLALLVDKTRLDSVIASVSARGWLN